MLLCRTACFRVGQPADQRDRVAALGQCADQGKGTQGKTAAALETNVCRLAGMVGGTWPVIGTRVLYQCTWPASDAVGFRVHSRQARRGGGRTLPNAGAKKDLAAQPAPQCSNDGVAGHW